MIDISTSNGVKSAQPKEKIELIGVLEHARRGINRPANGLGVKPIQGAGVPSLMDPCYSCYYPPSRAHPERKPIRVTWVKIAEPFYQDFLREAEYWLST